MPISSFGTVILTTFISSSHMLPIPASLAPQPGSAPSIRPTTSRWCNAKWGYIVSRASYPTVTSDACLRRLPLVAQRVRYHPLWRWLDNDKQSCRSVLWNKYLQYLTTMDRFHARTDLEDTCALKGVGIALGTIRKVGEAKFRHFLSVKLDLSQTSQCDDGLSVVTNQNQILVLFYRFEPRHREFRSDGTAADQAQHDPCRVAQGCG